MYVITLKFSENKDRAADLMPGHKDWIQDGFDKGFFLVVGSLEHGKGGGIVAAASNREDLEQFVSQDPFVKENVVSAEITGITPARVDERLGFLAA